MTRLSLEYTVLQLSRQPQVSIRTAGAFEVFFGFLILVGDIAVVCRLRPLATIAGIVSSIYPIGCMDQLHGP